LTQCSICEILNKQLTKGYIMTTLEAYKVRLQQLENGSAEFYEGEKELIIKILLAS